MEIARANGERLIDTQASAEMSRRLMAMQRQRLTASQVLDRRARRVLHDDVLPRLHTAMLTLGCEGTSLEGTSSSDTAALLADVHYRIADLLREIPAAAAPEVGRLGLVGALRQAVAGEMGRAFDDVSWRIEPEAERAAQAIPPLTAEVLFCAAREAIRNAVRHGRDADAGHPLCLRVGIAWRDGLEVVIEDDGVGVRAAGGSNGGSGQGLALHSTMMAVVGGSLVVESEPGAYTRVLLTLPL